MKTYGPGLSLLILPWLVAGCVSGESTPSDENPTWYRDIKPLVSQRCEGCHTPHGIGPFTLSSYDDAKAHAAAIADSVQSRRMPPWMPSADCQ